MNNTVPAAPVRLAPIPPAAIPRNEDERDALLETCDYTRKGEIPRMVVTRQQLIEDVLARGYVVMDVSTNKRTSAVQSVALRNPVTKQFYRFQRKGEVSYIQRRHAEVLTKLGQPSPAQAPEETDEGWRLGETVSQSYTSPDGETYQITGKVTINSAQRWRIRLEDTAGAPGLRLGQSFPALAASWKRAVSVPSKSVPKAQKPVPLPAAAEVDAKAAAVVPATSRLAAGSEVMLRPDCGGEVFGRVIATPSGQLVRVMKATGAAAMTFPRGRAVPFSPEWEQIGADAAATVSREPGMAPAPLTAPTPEALQNTAPAYSEFNQPSAEFEERCDALNLSGVLRLRTIVREAVEKSPNFVLSSATSRHDLYMQEVPKAIQALSASVASWTKGGAMAVDYTAAVESIRKEPTDWFVGLIEAERIAMDAMAERAGWAPDKRIAVRLENAQGAQPVEFDAMTVSEADHGIAGVAISAVREADDILVVDDRTGSVICRTGGLSVKEALAHAVDAAGGLDAFRAALQAREGIVAPEIEASAVPEMDEPQQDPSVRDPRDYLTGDRLQKVGNLGARLVALGMPEAPETYVAAFAVMEAVEQGKPCPVLAQLPCRQLYEELTGVQLAGKAGVVADEIVRSTAPQPVPPADTDSQVVDRVAGLPKVGEVFAVETHPIQLKGDTQSYEYAVVRGLYEPGYLTVAIRPVRPAGSEVAEWESAVVGHRTTMSAAIDRFVERLGWRVTDGTMIVLNPEVQARVDRAAKVRAAKVRAEVGLAVRREADLKQKFRDAIGAVKLPKSHRAVVRLLKTETDVPVTAYEGIPFVLRQGSGSVIHGPSGLRVADFVSRGVAQDFIRATILSGEDYSTGLHGDASALDHAKLTRLAELVRNFSTNGDYIVPAWFKPAQTTVAESAPAPEATVVPPAPAAAPVEQPPAPVPARAEETNPAAENVEPWQFRYETYLFRVGKEPDIARGVRDFIDPVSGKSIAQLREELRSAYKATIGQPFSASVSSANAQKENEIQTAILEHHIASVKAALEAGKPVPEVVKTEYELHIGIRPEMAPARSAIAEKYAQKMMRIHLDRDAKEREAMPRYPAKIYDAYDRRALAGYRKHMQDVVDKLDAKSPEIHSWINSNNFEGTISLMFEYTGWGDSRKTLKNAEACLKSWMGAEAYDAMIAKEAQDRAAAAEEQAKKEKDYRLNSAIQRLDGVSVRYTPRGQTEAQTVTRRQWLDAIIAEGYTRILRKGSRIWLTTPDHHAYVIRGDDVVYVEAQIEAAQKKEAEQAQPASAENQQPSPAPVAPIPEGNNKVEPPAAKEPAQPELALFPTAEPPASAPEGEESEPTEAEIGQAAIAASRAAALAEGGAAIGADKVEPLTIVDHHTAAGAQRMCVVGQGKDGTITLVPVPTAEHATEPIASVVALRENVTVPALDQAVLRRPAPEVFASFIQHAERASRELSPDDPLAKEVSTAIAFANRADAKGLAQALRQPDLAILIGDAILLFQPEVAHLAKTMKAELPPEMRNWYYSREDAAVKLAERGEAERFRANVEAIRLLKRIEAEERQATPQEKDALAAFSGWGAHKGLFNSKMAAIYKAVSDQYEKDDRTVAVYDYDTARNKEVKCETLKEYVALWGRNAVRVDYQPRNIKGEPIGEETTFFIRRLGYYYDYKNQPSGEESVIDGIPLKSVLEWGKKWAARREEVAALLTAEEWRQAEASSLNAFYTSPDVALRMWDIVKNLGFQGGKVLEPACGCGRIVSAMPPEYRDKCRIEAVELDPFSARISAKLLPEAKVHAADFREAPVAPNSCDLVITNVPFGSETVGDSGMNLHNWYIAECMTKLKPGGLAVIITTQHTMDSSADQREKLVQAVEFLDAFRLPNTAFDSEGTQVTTDILVLRKPSLALAKTGETWMRTTPIDIAPEHRPDAPKEDGKEEVEVASMAFVNEFYQRHPERVIGQHSLRGKLYGGVKDPAIGQYTVEPVGGIGEVSAALREQIASVKAVENSSAPAQSMTDEEIENTRIAALRAEKTGSLVLRNGTLYVVSASRDLVEWSSRPFVIGKDGAPDEAASAKFAEKNEPMARAYVELRGALIEQLAVDSSPESDEVKSATTRATLKAAYDGFTKKYGRLNAPRTRKLLKTISGSDPDLYTVFALEDPLRKRENGKSVTEFVPAQIISRRTLWPSVAPEKAENLLEGTYISMAERGRVDADYIARLLGREGQADAVRDELLKEGIAFRDVDGELVHREIYLTGDVNTKIQQARVMAEVDGAYMANVQALEAVLPPQIPYDEIVASGGMSLSASWLPAETLTAFVKAKVSFYGELVYKKNDGWVPARATGRERNWSQFFSGGAAQTEWGTKAMHFADILRCALAGVSPKAFDDEGHADPAGTREAELRVDAWKKAFGEWVAQRPEHRDAITDAYNRTFNRVILTKWDGSRLRFPGLAQGSYIPMAHQKDATMRMLLQRRGVIAHGVGFGKTLEIILAAAEMKRLGMVKKPMIVCDNANYEQIVREVYRCYPTARILQAEDGDMSPKGRDQWLGRCANGEWDFVIMSREQFGKIRVSPEREVAMLNAVIDQAEAEAQVAEGGRRASAQIKRKKEMFEKIKTRVEKLREKRGDGISFEQLGVDQLFVDESHRHKKIGIKTRFDVKGIDVGVSLRGFDLLMKANYLRELNGGGRGAIGFTGTPVSNTLAEIHTACVLFDPPTLAAFDVKTFDQFVTNFCEVRTQLELNESNGRWRYVERLARYVNGRSFSKLVNTAMDVRMNPDELGIKRPGHEVGGFESGICPLSRVVYEGQQQVASIYKEWEGMKPQDKAVLGWVPLVLMGLNTALSIDPRLVDPKAVVGKDALINGIADNIAEIYHAKNKGGKVTHTQVVFSDRKQSGNPKIKLDLARDWSRFDGAPEERVSHNAAQTDAVLSNAVADARAHLDEEEMPSAKSKDSGVIDLDAAVDEDEDEAEFKAAAAEEAAAAEAAAKVGASFNLWEELRRLLVARGVPADKIALISDAKSKPAKLELVDRMNAGEIAVLIGSRDRLGIGCNFQKLLYAAHAIDPSRSMTPDSMEQSWGRILRQGNTHEKVRCILYGMADTVIPAIYGRINTKAAAARQVWIDGTSAQFDASEDMAMEIMRAAMLTDSRAKDAACLLDQINDLELSIEAINNRRGTVANSFKNAEWQVQHLTKQLAEATHVRDWFAENVTPIQDATEHHVTIKFQKPANPWERTTIEKAGFKFDDDFNVKISGSADVVEKVFAKLITQWRAKEEDRAIAYLTWNGVPAHLGMRRQFHITGDKEFKLEVQIPNPLQPVIGEGGASRLNVYMSGTFLTPETMLTKLDAARNCAASHPNMVSRELEGWQKKVDEGRELLAKLESPDALRAQCADLRAKQKALLDDMQERPFAGQLPAPAGAKRCEITYTVPEKEARTQEARKAAGETATAAKEAAEAAKAAKAALEAAQADAEVAKAARPPTEPAPHRMLSPTPQAEDAGKGTGGVRR